MPAVDAVAPVLSEALEAGARLNGEGLVDGADEETVGIVKGAGAGAGAAEAEGPLDAVVEAGLAGVPAGVVEPARPPSENIPKAGFEASEDEVVAAPRVKGEAGLLGVSAGLERANPAKGDAAAVLVDGASAGLDVPNPANAGAVAFAADTGAALAPDVAALAAGLLRLNPVKGVGVDEVVGLSVGFERFNENGVEVPDDAAVEAAPDGISAGLGVPKPVNAGIAGVVVAGVVDAGAVEVADSADLPNPVNALNGEGAFAGWAGLERLPKPVNAGAAAGVLEGVDIAGVPKPANAGAVLEAGAADVLVLPNKDPPEVVGLLASFDGAALPKLSFGAEGVLAGVVEPKRFPEGAVEFPPPKRPPPAGADVAGFAPNKPPPVDGVVVPEVFPNIPPEAGVAVVDPNALAPVDAADPNAKVGWDEALDEPKILPLAGAFEPRLPKPLVAGAAEPKDSPLPVTGWDDVVFEPNILPPVDAGVEVACVPKPAKGEALVVAVPNGDDDAADPNDNLGGCDVA